LTATPPAWMEPPPKKKRRTGLIVSLVLVVVLLLCGGVASTAYVLSSRTTGKGQADPVTAVSDFLTAVYNDQSTTEAAKYVCQQSNDSGTIAKKIKELQAAKASYTTPSYTWATPTMTNKTSSEATVTATIVMTTGDEKQSSQDLTLTTTQSNGWWVCEVRSGK
jgi:flagellar basal body-associated protein FliL